MSIFGRLHQQKSIALSDYGMESLRNLLAAFLRDRGREPTDREARGLARIAAYMQHNHENPSAETDYDAVGALSRGLYGRDVSNDEVMTFVNMVATAYPIQIGTRR